MLSYVFPLAEKNVTEIPPTSVTPTDINVSMQGNTKNILAGNLPLQNLNLNINSEYSALNNQCNTYNINENIIKDRPTKLCTHNFMEDTRLVAMDDKADEHTKLLKNENTSNAKFVASTKYGVNCSHILPNANNNDNFFINNNQNRIERADEIYFGNNQNCEQAEESRVSICNTDSDTCEMQNSTQLTTSKKISRITNKAVGLKRVSFGSSKGSMVETLVYETPTPLSEQVEPVFGNLPTNASLLLTSMDDSGIDLQEELQRSVVRVSIYQSSQPRQVCPPEIVNSLTGNQELLQSFSTDHYSLDNMTAAGTMSCERQQSTDSGWDNPFRPGGDLSIEADKIVNMIKGGKPITPTDDQHIENGNAHKEEHSKESGVAAVDGVTAKNVTQNQSVQNGTTSLPIQSAERPPGSNGTTTQAQVSNKVVPGPTSASHVVIGEKKNKKKNCCVIQ